MNPIANKEFSLLGHKPALFVLFFTEMWERFSYYGMRAIFVLFLTASFSDGGWEWTRERALGLLGIYTSSVYLTPLIGGIIADKLLGYQKAVALGALIMTLGHACMAFESEVTLYLGIGFLIIGNGLFKPNVTSIVSGLYDTYPERKDGAYTIFYMGVNAGGFLGVLLCGFLANNLNYSWGFGLAGIFMFLGTLQFWFGKDIFENVGTTPSKKEIIIEDNATSEALENSNKIQKDRYIVVGLLAFFTVFFWWAFEQASGSMNIFARDYTQRALTGNSAIIFKIVDILVSTVPLIIISWVLIKLFKQTISKITLSNIILGISFVSIWGIVFWKLSVIIPQENAEIEASWFLILNSLFIIFLAPLFSKWWESKFNPSAAVKFGIGMILLGIGFAALAYGSSGIPQGAKTASVSLVWLFLAYLFHTMGELCVSPVGLSYVSKLVPAKKIGMMFGIWYLVNALGNYLAAKTGSYIDPIVEQYSMSFFFLIFTFIPMVVGLIFLVLHPIIKKLMHGIR
ncbi:MAG: peptide MFS transporter [Flavobacteriia bacterium]|nr:peptide MFS transporter [Flavobacteriia bacterium]OIP48555.1 MAG: MFS transporter [Flavobacteriaceae bacterium CG2_30_31_66]PIV97076.1 MAG: MFS transporter [Flavobacteriaceae bacterium CG17_big_fil_post_rev_8_21_14_2_50_31_13]PIX13853.1 MAG: MFS transporter [Flavobacteriaceae bacterium CG_4_8_14_3_um_filter_31_8]PIY13701.1 MAG: MFS transporter [Flavobacteriaceae bacterium CG_4_10_14_3_um_filter_31_253]PIZ10805.1 MAG: MFS transporter [Flavobacteriaceae bacterium CG_4_10_14_0_8_um_filter_31_9